MGTVVRVFKDDTTAVYLRLKEKDYLLRRLGYSLGGDDVLEKLVSKKIKADGVIDGDTFILAAWSMVR